MQEFREAIDVKQALIKQIVETIDTTLYLKRSLQNVDTNTINKEVHEILAHLFWRYDGKVTSEKRQTTEQEVKAFTYNWQDPLVNPIWQSGGYMIDFKYHTFSL